MMQESAMFIDDFLAFTQRAAPGQAAPAQAAPGQAAREPVPGGRNPARSDQ
jgi:hypothetical protein